MNGNGSSNGNGDNARQPKDKVPVMQLYERLNRKGERYLVGRFGVAKLLIVATGREGDHGEPVWQAFIGEGIQLGEAVTALASADEEKAR